MEDQEILKIWKSMDEKLEEARVLNLQYWVLNLQSFETLQTSKAKIKMDALAGFKIRAVILGILYVLFLSVHAWGNHFKNIYFTVSILLILLINLYVTAVYIHHIVLIRH